MFTLDAQVCGTSRSVSAVSAVSAESDGTGITVRTSGGRVRARSMQDAIRIAREDIGRFLQPAQRGGKPWGLRVVVGSVQAVYGEWPLLPPSGGPGGGRPDNSPVTRIRRDYNDSSGPLGALENAIRIIRAYLPSARAAA